MSDISADEATLKRKLLELDVQMRSRQLWWEHPKNAAVVLGVIVALVAAVAGVTGFQLAHRAPQPIIVQFGEQPLHVQMAPAPRTGG